MYDFTHDAAANALGANPHRLVRALGGHDLQPLEIGLELTAGNAGGLRADAARPVVRAGRGPLALERVLQHAERVVTVLELPLRELLAAAAFAASSSTCIFLIISAMSAICFSIALMFDMARRGFRIGVLPKQQRKVAKGLEPKRLRKGL